MNREKIKSALGWSLATIVGLGIVALSWRSDGFDPFTGRIGYTITSKPKDVGVGGKEVLAMFENWGSRRYIEMSRQINSPIGPDLFKLQMSLSPISFNDVKIISEKPDGKDWLVTVSFDITDITSAYAGAILNLTICAKKQNNCVYFVSPKMTKTEKFTTITQTWKVVMSDKNAYIDMQSGEPNSPNAKNIMKYVLESSTFDKFMGLKDPPLEITLIGRKWLVNQLMATDGSVSEIDQIIRDAKPISEEAMDYFLKKINL